MSDTIDLSEIRKPGGVKMIEGSDEMRANKCLQQIQKILAAFDCAMAPMIVLGPQGVQRASVNVIPIPRQPKGVVTGGAGSGAGSSMLGGGVKNGG